ncbi:E3 ubiquitin-protein ligase NRDP1-like protein [Dinothrombium tinctorium]|uniref:E3 ubiquitin-protein ligase NRDP1-like protein n=1 Tax=Dinothrombium tinctorium TaxID=1965070 RepID=A0A443QGZ9_9ACAR|nr:E3 ubiquitin-protein ligase NRDP1-like protein [Dinothrombium tinctorium]
MAIDKQRVVGVDEQILNDYLCKKCGKIFFEPTITKCEHTFCRSCIEESIENLGTCAECGASCEIADLRSVRQLKAILGKLSVRCIYRKFGCETNVKLCELNEHQNECGSQTIHCSKKCKMPILLKDYETHDCVEFLLRTLDATISNLKVKEINILLLYDSISTVEEQLKNEKKENAKLRSQLCFEKSKEESLKSTVEGENEAINREPSKSLKRLAESNTTNVKNPRGKIVHFRSKGKWKSIIKKPQN